MCAGSTLFDPADMQGTRPEHNLIPAQVDEFGSPQTVAVSHEDHGRISVGPPVVLGRLL
jgi:hypothetical protein